MTFSCVSHARMRVRGDVCAYACAWENGRVSMRVSENQLPRAWQGRGLGMMSRRLKSLPRMTFLHHHPG